MDWSLSRTAIRVAALIVLGSVLFTLPDSVDLPTTGDFWWTTGLERYAVYCIPYPFAAWLIDSRRQHWIPALTCAAVGGALVLAWPQLHSRLQNQTAAVLRRELGVPTAMVYTVNYPGAQPFGGYFVDDSGLSESYNIAGYADLGNGDPYDSDSSGDPYLGYDLVLTIFPGSAASPRPVIANLLMDSTGFSGDPTSSSCRSQGDGAWIYNDDYQGATQIKREAGYFIAVTATAQAPSLEAQFPTLFASLRHPTAAQIVAIGLSGPPSPLQ
jgi:hypothetical protein